MIQGNINSIETFGAVGGPGVRYIVFLQGCRMRCQYCHNPETWGDSAEGSYLETPAETFRKAWRYHSYWKNGGGITVSGGEALLQVDYVTEVTDLFLLDLKQIDCGKHKKLTGWVNDNIRDLAVYLAVHRKKMWIRHVLVPGITTDEEDLKRLRSFLDHLREICPDCVELVEVLPYHTMGIAKYEKLGIPYPLEGVQPPTAEEIRRAEEILKG